MKFPNKKYVCCDHENIPDGIYNGKWYGYIVSINLNDCKYEIHSSLPIEEETNCILTVKNGIAYVEYK